MPEQPEVVAVSPALTRASYGADTRRGDPLHLERSHTWPGGHLGLYLRPFLGRTSTEIDATAKISDFHQAHAVEA